MELTIHYLNFTIVQKTFNSHRDDPINLVSRNVSQSYQNIEDKHGKPLDEFLKAPTSAVISSVIQGNPLSDEQRAKIVEPLKKASEQS